MRCLTHCGCLVAFIHTDLRRSAIGLGIATTVFVVWVIVFQTSWKSWGQAGEDLLVVPPNRTSSCRPTQSAPVCRLTLGICAQATGSDSRAPAVVRAVALQSSPANAFALLESTTCTRWSWRWITRRCIVAFVSVCVHTHTFTRIPSSHTNKR